MIQNLTLRQQEVLAFVRKALKHHGLPPTRSEIAEALGFKSANAAEDHLRALARKGALMLVLPSREDRRSGTAAIWAP